MGTSIVTVFKIPSLFDRIGVRHRSAWGSRRRRHRDIGQREITRQEERVDRIEEDPRANSKENTEDGVPDALLRFALRSRRGCTHQLDTAVDEHDDREDPCETDRYLDDSLEIL